jgi:hypothetical protein
MQNVEDYAGSAGTEPHTWETGLMDTITYVALDVHKATVSVAVAESGRDGEIRQIGVFESRPEVPAKLAARLAKGGAAPELLLRSRSLRVMGCTPRNGRPFRVDAKQRAQKPGFQ